MLAKKYVPHRSKASPIIMKLSKSDQSAIDAAGITSQIVQVAVPLPVRAKGPLCYDYLVPDDLAPASGVPIGQIVEVPLGKRAVWGIVISDEPSGDVVPDRLKEMISIASLRPLDELHMRFLSLVSDWTMAPFGMVMRMMLSTPKACLPPPTKSVYTTAKEASAPNISTSQAKITPKREKVLAFLAEGHAMSASELAKETGVSQAVIKTMAEQNLLSSHEILDEPSLAYHYAPGRLSLLPLSDAQKQVSDGIEATLDKGYCAHLIDGVTGSGKTEVYFQLVAKMMASHKQVLILLPEIALTGAWQSRFEARFGMSPHIWHSSVSAAKRRHLWRAVLKGEPVIVVGARSALFLPFTNLGLIIVDEEHEQAFKQEDMVIYHARDMAVMRAHIESVPVVLATATPSLESWVNAGQGTITPKEAQQSAKSDNPRYHHWRLKARIGTSNLPEIEMVDMKQDRPPAGKWLSQRLLTATKACLDANKQALFFLNRRGYAPLSICEACGTKAKCNHCDSWLVTHRLSGARQCHHCGFRQPLRNHCESCGQEGQMRAYGPGVERLAEEVMGHFPDARICILSSDTAARPETAAEMIRAITDGEVDIIIGTQMAAKGHHFPDLTLVGVVDADFGLQGGDLRAAERTYQMLSQASGRAGRGSEKGVAYLQSYEPDNAVFKALISGDRDAFLSLETQMRASAAMPPFGRLAAIILSGVDEASVEKAAKQLGEARPHYRDVSIFGPTPAPIARIRGRYRMRFLIRAPREVNLQKIIQQWLENQRIPSQIFLQIDIDPYSFM